MDPLFSVVIPTYNRAHLIGKTLASLAAQTYRNFEVLIVDDGSTDNTEAAVQPWLSQQVYYHKKENAERAAARNYGARLARGRYLNFLDSDDTVYPHHLAAAADSISLTHEPPVVVLGYDIRDEQGRIVRQPTPLQNIPQQILSGNLLSCNGVIVRTDIARAHPFCDRRDLAGLEDWELWIRLAARYPFVVNRQVTSTILEHDTRSVVSGSLPAIESKVKAFQEEVVNDPATRQTYGSRISRTVASASTYAALHLALARAPRPTVLRYLLQGVRAYPGVVFTRRFLVILSLLAR